MKFRKANKNDIENIMPIIKQGQDFLREQGVNQWIDNYPDKDIIEEDIQKEYGYIVEEESQILATAAISFDGEVTYEKIYDGKWLTNGDYCVIHRMAIHKDKRGSDVSTFMMNSMESLCKEKGVKSIKVDTHRRNIPMQQYLKKNGFDYCGVIFLSDGDERLAFEKILK